MRMRRRRRKPAVAWFPTLQQEPALPEGCTATTSAGQWPNWLIGDITVNPSTDCPGEKTQIADLTWDFPIEEEILLNQVPSLADFQGSAWRLRRMVGNLTVVAYDISGQPSYTTPQPCMVGAGLIVLRVDEVGNPTEDDREYSPLMVKNIRDPWIWRRTWVLQPQTTIIPTQTNWIQHEYPMGNWMYGNSLQNGYIDAKTNRRIGAEERLFLCIDAQRRNFEQTPQGVGTSINWTLDYRLLGSLMKETNRRNASR